MNKQNNLRRAMDKALPGLEQNVWFEQRVLARIREPERVRRLSKRSMALALLALMLLLSVTAVAATLLSGREVADEYAVPMALENDTETYVEGSYTHQELADLIRVLNENGLNLEEESTIMQALQDGYGYWEKDVITAICEEAFGGRFYAWSAEEKYWYDDMLVKIGAKERNWYCMPEEGDMTVPEAREYAAALLNEAYDLALPAQSDEMWLICEYFFAADEVNPATWRFDFVNRADSAIQYGVNFDREGRVILVEDVGAIQASQEQSMIALELAGEDPDREAAYRRRQEAYEKYQEIHGDNWWFWPLEAQQEAMGGNHHIPEGDELTRDEAVSLALNAICEQYGAEALARLGEYHVGAICKCYQESEGMWITWCIYVTSDPVYVSDGFRVDFDDPVGIQKTPGVEVRQANAENG